MGGRDVSIPLTSGPGHSLVLILFATTPASKHETSSGDIAQSNLAYSKILH